MNIKIPKLFIFCILTLLSIGYTSNLNAVCNWKSRNASFAAVDSCKSNINQVKFVGYIAFNNSNQGCLRYTWKVNNTVIGYGSSFSYTSTQNGTYNICVTVRDTCNNCDTTYCASKTITCLRNTCAWYKRSVSVSWVDSCKGIFTPYSIGGTVNNGSGCYKYQWSFNNQALSTNNKVLQALSANGTYSLCVKISDTCDKCDTTICKTFNVSCIPSACNWKSKAGNFISYDSCNRNANYAHFITSFNFNNSNSNCFKYTWKVNGSSIGAYSNPNTIKKIVNQNGTYTICVTVYDSCKKCDTTYCTTKNVSCFKNCIFGWSNVGYLITDTCNGYGPNKYAIGGYASTSNKCNKFEWYVNSARIYGSNNNLYYPVKSNGTYSVCLKIIDTCRKCDTTICSTRTFTCVSNSKCNWKSKNFGFYVWDSCKSNASSIQAELSVGSNPTNCLKYTWKINNTLIYHKNFYRYIKQSIYQSGTYTVSVTVYDTCNNCDTTYTKTITSNCFNKCNWKSRSPYAYGWDTCRGTNYRNSVNGYISFNYNNKGCFKYSWSVNGTSIPGTNNYFFSYTVTKNGTYNYCVKVTDTCNKCDTSFCFTKTVTCFPSCNWKGRSPYMYGWDTCKGPGYRNSVNAYISFNYSKQSCFRYSWTVNGNAVSGTNSNILHYPINKNGTYNICVKVIDTCSNCDTVICVTKNISCFPSCNWKKRLYTINVTDTCRNNKNENSSTGYIMLNPNMNNTCVKYTWKIDNVVVSNTYYFRTFIKKNGTHNYCVTMIDTCTKCDTTICFTRTFNCRSLSVNSAEIEKLIQIHPIPAQQSVTIESEIERSNAVVYDINGKVVWKGTISIGDNQINVSDWSNGIYILTIMNHEGILTRKILKE